MNTEILNYYSKFNKKIEEIIQEDLRDLEVIKKGIVFCKQYLQVLRVLIRTQEFQNLEQEIHFFKFIKPKINGYLKFFVYIYQIEIKIPITSSKLKQKYLKNEMVEIEKKRLKFVEFYNYYLNKETKLDHFYFVRDIDGVHNIADTSYFFADPEFSTSHDNLFSNFINYEMLEIHLQNLLTNIKREREKQTQIVRKPDILQESNWTGSKTDLVELIYSLKAAAAINNGSKELNKMVGAVEELFDIEINNHYKIYQKIKYRSGNSTKFLDELKLSLQNKIDSEDL